MSPLWKDMYAQQLDLFQQIVENPNPFRFDIRCIGVSDVASQYFCEKEVDFKYLLGDIDTEEKLFGRDAHGKLIEDFKKTSSKKGWKQIFSLPRCEISESLFLAEYNGLYFAFIPDRIIFERGIPKLLIEFKFSKYQRPFISYHVQLQVEALLLNKIGFNTEELYYTIIIAPMDPQGGSFHNPEVLSYFLNEIPTLIWNKLSKNNQKEYFDLSFKDIIAYTYLFDYSKALERLEWAIKYWTKEREAVATKNKNKCKSCEYHESCKASKIARISN